MASLSSVVVDFIANTAKYVAGLTQMSKQTKTWSNDIKKDVNALGNVFQSFASGGIGAGTKAFANFAKGASGATVALGGIGTAFGLVTKISVEYASQLTDLSDRFNLTIGDAQDLQGAFSKYGVSLEQVGSFTEKLSRSALEAADGNDKLAATFGRLGVDVDKFNKLTEKEKLVEFSKALAGIQDPAERARIAFELGGKSASKLLKGLNDIGTGAVDFNDVFKNSPEAIAALDQLGDALDTARLNLKKWSAEAVGQIFRVIKGFVDLAEQSRNTQPPSWFNRGGQGLSQMQREKTPDELEKERKAAEEGLLRRQTATRVQNKLFDEQIVKYQASTNVFSKYKEEVNKINEETAKLLKGQYDQINVQTILAAQSERLADATRKYNESLGSADSILAAIDNGSKFRIQLDGLNKSIDDYNKKQDQAKKSYNKIFEIDRIRLTQDLRDSIDQQKNSFIAAFDPTVKYNEALKAAERVTDSAGRKLSSSQISSYIRSLSDSFREVIDPGFRYVKLLQDLSAREAIGSITAKERIDIINNLGQAYREAYDPLAKFSKAAAEVNALPSGANVDRARYIKTLAQGYTDLLDPTAALKRQLEEVDALNKTVAKSTLQRAIPLKDLTFQTKALSDEDAARTKKLLQDQFTLNKEQQQALLTEDKKLIAAAQYKQVQFDINRLFGEQPKSVEEQLRKQEALRANQARYFAEVSPYFKEIASFGYAFADGIAQAVTAGQSFSDAFKNVFQSVLRDIQVLILRTIILNALFRAIGFATGGIASVPAQAFAQLTGIDRRAQGGPVMAGEPYMVGEQGAELFVPRSNGYILPNDFQGMGEPVIVNQTINIQTGVAQTVRAEMLNLLPRFKQDAMAGVLDAKQRGGSYAKGLAA